MPDVQFGKAFPHYRPSKNLSMRIFWDLGAFDGCNLHYYLKKADLVVAVEGNSVLCEIINDKFRREIQEGNLVLENRILVAEKLNEKQTFYVNKTNLRLSTSLKPAKEILYERQEVPAISVKELEAKYGKPDFVKIDLEGLDRFIVAELMNLDIFPNFISVEACELDPLEILYASGRYNSFKLVEGELVPLLSKNLKIQTKTGFECLTFESGSAGPCSEDLAGPWFSFEDIRKEFVRNPHVKWRDIHATFIPNSQFHLRKAKLFSSFFDRATRRFARKLHSISRV